MQETKNRLQQALDAAVKAGRTQKDIAAATGIDESTICHYKLGTRYPRGVNLIRLARELGLKLEDLDDEKVGDQGIDGRSPFV